MANTSKPEEPPDANQTMEQANLGWESSFPLFGNAKKASEGKNSVKASAGAGSKNSNVKKQKVSPEIDEPSSLSELVKNAVRDTVSELAKRTIGKVKEKIEKAVKTVEKVSDFFVPGGGISKTESKEEKAKKEMKEKMEAEQNRNAKGNAQTKRYLKAIADQLKRFTDALAVLLNPASNREAGSRSGYMEEGQQAVNGLKELIQGLSKNASPQLRRYLKENNLDLEKNNGMQDWLDRLGAAMKNGDERALQGFRNEWRQIQKQFNRFLNQVLKMPEEEAVRKEQQTRQTADRETAKKSQQRVSTSLEAEQNKLNNRTAGNSRNPEFARKQNQPNRVLTNIEAERKKLIEKPAHHLEKALKMGKKPLENRKGTLTNLQAERNKLGFQNESKHSMANTVVPFAKGNVAEKSPQVTDIQKMKVPISKDLEMVRTATFSMSH